MASWVVPVKFWPKNISLASMSIVKWTSTYIYVSTAVLQNCSSWNESRHFLATAKHWHARRLVINSSVWDVCRQTWQSHHIALHRPYRVAFPDFPPLRPLSPLLPYSSTLSFPSHPASCIIHSLRLPFTGRRPQFPPRTSLRPIKTIKSCRLA